MQLKLNIFISINHLNKYYIYFYAQIFMQISIYIYKSLINLVIIIIIFLHKKQFNKI